MNAFSQVTSRKRAAVDVGDEHAGGVRADVDAGAAHTLPPIMTAAIEVHGLRKAYGDHEAVRGIDFSVARGEVFGLLGPNGAGKTTTVEILEGYRERDAGDVRVLGLDPADRPAELRERVGIVLQSCGIYRHLTVRESVTHWAGLYPAPRDVEETIALAGLAEAADQRTRTLSGGQQRRLDFALALIGDPELIFLDEPTTGFDPEARRNAWDTVRSLRDLGKTILLTTHYLDEAQALADRVAIVKDGAILAEGAPAELGVGDAARYRVSWRAGGRARRARDRRPDAAAARGHGRGARPRRGARGARGHPPVAGGRLPGADARDRPGARRCRARRERVPAAGRGSPGASTGWSAACSGATRARRSSTSCCRCCSWPCSGRSSPASRPTST